VPSTLDSSRPNRSIPTSIQRSSRPHLLLYFYAQNGTRPLSHGCQWQSFFKAQPALSLLSPSPLSILKITTIPPTSAFSFFFPSFPPQRLSSKIRSGCEQSCSLSLDEVREPGFFWRDCLFFCNHVR
jgi:hypothetical protein